MNKLDPVALAGRRAKGKRPWFFNDPDVERVLSITMALAMEHAVTRQRLDALERLLEQQGVFSREQLDQFQPAREAEAERTQWFKEYIARILRIVQQETEALEEAGMDDSMEQIMDELGNT